MIKESGIDVRYYSIIYEAIDDVKQMLSGMLAPEVKEQIVGLAEVREVFRSSKFGTVAGCIVADGYVRRNNPIRVLRDNVVIFEGGLESLRRFKDDVNEVRAGTECGIGVKNYNDVRVGDQIECFSRVEVARTVRVSLSRSRRVAACPTSLSPRRRVAQQIQRALSELIRREVRDPRLGMVTLTEVRVSKRPELREGLLLRARRASRSRRRKSSTRPPTCCAARSAARSALRHSPELRFVHDELIESGARLSALIQQGREGRRRTSRRRRRQRSRRRRSTRRADVMSKPRRFHRDVDGILLLDKAARRCLRTPRCSRSARCSARARPVMPAASIRSPPACCRSVSGRRPRSAAGC